MRRFRERPNPGEALAIDRRGDLMDFLMAEPVAPNYEIDGACVITIRGPLEHNNVGYGDSYEQIRCRFQEAAESQSPCIIMRLDTPGGVVAGLNECVMDLQRCAKEYNKYVISYVDELCASAGYAISLASKEMVVPRSGITGSIGVISYIVSQKKADEKAGVEWVTIMSGARKDDGHVHSEITDEAIAAESKRVNDLANQFFEMVRAARSIDARPLEAAIFLGQDAVDVGIAHTVMGWSRLVEYVGEEFGDGALVVA